MATVAQTLSDQVFTLVRDRILAGKLSSTSAIRQDALAAELGVSKIPLREAFVRLEQDGLLVSHANRGFFVRPMSTREVEEVYALRLKLEPDAVAMGATHATDVDRNLARQALDDSGEAIARRGADIGKYNRAFHLSLVRPAGQVLTLQLLERLHILSERYVAKHIEPAGRDQRANTEHARILDAWRAGRSDEAARLTHLHLAEGLEDLRRQLGG